MLSAHSAGELQCRLPAAGVKLVDRCKVLGLEVIDILPRVRQRGKDRGP